MSSQDAAFRSGWMPGMWAGVMLGIFFLIPFVIMLSFSFYYKVPGGLYEPAFVFDQYFRFWSPFFAKILFVSTAICSFASLLALVIGFALAYCIKEMRSKGRTLWLILVVSILSLSEVIIAFSWNTLLSRSAGIGSWLAAVGVLDRAQAYTPGLGAVLIALTFICIPFVVLVLFPPLTRLPRDWVEAARTLGATPLTAIRTVVLPSIRKPLVAAYVLVFIFSLGSYVIPIMLGRPRHWTLSVHITDQALYQSNFPFAAALAVFLVVTSLILISFANRLQGKT